MKFLYATKMVALLVMASLSTQCQAEGAPAPSETASAAAAPTPKKPAAKRKTASQTPTLRQLTSSFEKHCDSQAGANDIGSWVRRNRSQLAAYGRSTGHSANPENAALAAMKKYFNSVCNQGDRTMMEIRTYAWYSEMIDEAQGALGEMQAAAGASSSDEKGALAAEKAAWKRLASAYEELYADMDLLATGGGAHGVYPETGALRKASQAPATGTYKDTQIDAIAQAIVEWLPGRLERMVGTWDGDVPEFCMEGYRSAKACLPAFEKALLQWVKARERLVTSNPSKYTNAQTMTVLGQMQKNFMGL